MADSVGWMRALLHSSTIANYIEQCTGITNVTQINPNVLAFFHTVTSLFSFMGSYVHALLNQLAACLASVIDLT